MKYKAWSLIAGTEEGDLVSLIDYIQAVMNEMQVGGGGARVKKRKTETWRSETAKWKETGKLSKLKGKWELVKQQETEDYEGF